MIVFVVVVAVVPLDGILGCGVMGAFSAGALRVSFSPTAADDCPGAGDDPDNDWSFASLLSRIYSSQNH